jgi:hypothetical protein
MTETETETETGIVIVTEIETGTAIEAGTEFGTTATEIETETETEVEIEIAVTELVREDAHEIIRAIARETDIDDAEAQERRAVPSKTAARRSYQRKSCLASKKRLWLTCSGIANESRPSSLSWRLTRS